MASPSTQALQAPSKRAHKDRLYEQVARIGKAVASPKRIELLDLLAQGEKTVEQLAAELAISVKLASAHLRALRQAELVLPRRAGKFMVYRLSGPAAGQLSHRLRTVAQAQLQAMHKAVDEVLGGREPLTLLDRQRLLQQAARGDICLLDVRPLEEFRHAHLPHARSMPLSTLRDRLAELPRDQTIVAYCRGPFCLFAEEALQLLRRRGFKTQSWHEGVQEWAAAGLPLVHETAQETLHETV